MVILQFYANSFIHLGYSLEVAHPALVWHQCVHFPGSAVHNIFTKSGNTLIISVKKAGFSSSARTSFVLCLGITDRDIGIAYSR
jgi:hypothetical protein